VRATLALSMLAALLAVPTAHAEPLVQRAMARQHHIGVALHRIAARQGIHADQVAAQIARVRHGLAHSPSPLMSGASRWRSTRHHTRDAIAHLRTRLDLHERATLDLVRRLRAERDALTGWLATWGTFQTCPVAGPNQVANNFGVVVDLPEVPVHVHMGNDIMAATGTPIVAPFDGDASASSSVLGGLEVRVRGVDGYAYNAHLSSYGQLGLVQGGDVIGYVGSTGDATGPHDHFEWHPADGPAVDPNPLLSVVC
jgi:Peptidase family M23